MAASSAQEKAEQELTITRVFDAPRELVFKVWTDPKHLSAVVGSTWVYEPSLRGGPAAGRLHPHSHARA